jgi:hypothetical protein
MAAMRNSRAIGIAAGLTMVSALAALRCCTWTLPPRIDPRPHRAAGQALASETLRRLEAGGQIAVITRDTTDFPQPAIDLVFDSFRKALRRKQASITTVRSLEVDPLRPVEVPSGDFYELIRKTPAGGVIVSLMGPPLLTEEQRNQLPTARPKIVAFCPGNLPGRVDLRPLFEEQLLDVAIVNRGRAPARKGFAANAREQECFQSVSAANVASLYSETSEATAER